MFRKRWGTGRDVTSVHEWSVPVRARVIPKQPPGAKWDSPGVDHVVDRNRPAVCRMYTGQARFVPFDLTALHHFSLDTIHVSSTIAFKPAHSSTRQIIMSSPAASPIQGKSDSYPCLRLLWEAQSYTSTLCLCHSFPLAAPRIAAYYFQRCTHPSEGRK